MKTLLAYNAQNKISPSKQNFINHESSCSYLQTILTIYVFEGDML